MVREAEMKTLGEEFVLEKKDRHTHTEREVISLIFSMS